MAIDINDPKNSVKRVLIRKKFPTLDAPVDYPIQEVSDNDLIEKKKSKRDLREEENEFASIYESSDLGEYIRKVEWGDFDVEKIVNLLVAVCKKLTDSPLFPYQEPYQRAVFRSILNNWGDTITYLVSRQAGKTTVTGFTIATCCVVIPTLAKQFPEQLGVYAKGFKVGIYAPSEDQAITMWSRIQEVAHSASAWEVYSDPDINIHLGQRGLSWSNGSSVYMKSSSKQAKLESKTFHLLVTDETQDINEAVFEAKLNPMVAWTNGTVVHLGTPSEEPCFFFDEIEANKEDLMAGKRKCHFEYDCFEVIKYNARYAAHLSKAKRRLGEDSIAFRKSYLLEWVFRRSNPFVFDKVKPYVFSKPVQLIHTTDAPVVAGID